MIRRSFIIAAACSVPSLWPRLYDPGSTRNIWPDMLSISFAWPRDMFVWFWFAVCWHIQMAMSAHHVALWLDRWESMSMLAALEAMLCCSMASERGASVVIPYRTGWIFKRSQPQQNHGGPCKFAAATDDHGWSNCGFRCWSIETVGPLGQGMVFLLTSTFLQHTGGMGGLPDDWHQPVQGLLQIVCHHEMIYNYGCFFWDTWFLIDRSQRERERNYSFSICLMQDDQFPFSLVSRCYLSIKFNINSILWCLWFTAAILILILWCVIICNPWHLVLTHCCFNFNTETSEFTSRHPRCSLMAGCKLCIWRDPILVSNISSGVQ